MRKNFSTPEVAKALKLDFSPSALVNLNLDKVGSICKQILSREDFTEYNREKWDNPTLYKINGSSSEQSQFFSIGNALNFRFWKRQGSKIIKLKGAKKGQEFSGSQYMWRCLHICVEEGLHPLLEASFLSKITNEQFDYIFKTDDGNNPFETGKEERINNLRDLGSKLIAKWEGSFFNIIKVSNGSLVKFAKLSKEFVAYDDPYYKLTMVNAILHLGSGIAEFNDEPLPGIDYQLLKQLLRHGILEPKKELASKLKRKEIITTEEASELRRVALHAFVKISSITKISGEILDNKWWMNRLKCTDVNPVCQNHDTAHECPFYGVCDQRIIFEIPLELTRYY